MSGGNQYMAQQPQMDMGPGPMMQQGKDAQTFMWAQHGWDSGIHSGQNTGAPSIMSGASSLHDDLLYNDPYTPAGGFTAEQVDEINAQYNDTRSQRIRAAMFPETLEESEMKQPGVMDLGQASNVMRLSEPSQMLKTAVVNLINYQDDAELATRAIPELIRLLSDQDQVVVGQAAMMVHQLSKKDAPLRAMVNNPLLVQAVVKAMGETSDPTITKYTAGTLYHMSQHSQGLVAIFQSGGIRALVRLLSSQVDSVVFYAITTLHNLLLHQDGAKQTVRIEGGIEKMVALLDKNTPKFLAILTDCLQILSYGHAESKLRILASGGPAKLVHIMRSFIYEKLLWTTSRVLKVLSVCPQNKPAIVQAGGMQALTPHLTHASQRLVQNCLWTLRNLSDAATKEENMHDLLMGLIGLLGSSDVDVVTCCAGILSNLTCNNQRNKKNVCESGGIECLIRTLQAHHTREDITEPGLCSLRHLTTRHPDSALAQNEVRLHNGVPVVCQLLRTNRPLLVKAALGLVRNLAMCEANLTPLREQEAVQLCAGALQAAFGETQKARQMGQGPPVIDGVNLMEIVDISVGALQYLAKDKMNRDIIRHNLELIPIFVHLLSYEMENILRVSGGVLCELSKEREGATGIETAGATPRLTELLHSQNEGITTYAAAILYNMGIDKPEEYQKQLEMEMASALCRDDSAPWTQDGLAEMQGLQDESLADILYSQNSYDPQNLGMDQMHLGSPAGAPWGPPMNQGSMHHQYPNGQMQHPAQPQPPMNAGWYDTDL